MTTCSMSPGSHGSTVAPVGMVTGSSSGPVRMLSLSRTCAASPSHSSSSSTVPAKAPMRKCIRSGMRGMPSTLPTADQPGPGLAVDAHPVAEDRDRRLLDELAVVVLHRLQLAGVREHRVQARRRRRARRTAG